MPEVSPTIERARALITALSQKITEISENKPKRGDKLMTGDEFIARLRALRELDDVERDLFLCLDRIHPTQQIPHRRFVWSREHGKIVERDPKPMLDVVTQICCALYYLKMIHGSYGMALTNHYNGDLFGYQFDNDHEVEQEKQVYEHPDHIARAASLDVVAQVKLAREEKLAAMATATRPMSPAVPESADTSPSYLPTKQSSSGTEAEPYLIEFDDDDVAEQKTMSEVKVARREDSAIFPRPTYHDRRDDSIMVPVFSSSGSEQCHGRQDQSEKDEDQVSNFAPVDLDAMEEEREQEREHDRRAEPLLLSSDVPPTFFGTRANSLFDPQIEPPEAEVDEVDDVVEQLQQLDISLI